MWQRRRKRSWAIAVILALMWMCLPAPHALAQAPAQLRLLGQIGGVASAAAWDGQRLYVGIGPRLVVYEVANLATPTRIGQSDVLPGLVRDVKIVGGYAFVAADRAGLLVLSLAAATRPHLVAMVSTPAPALDLEMSGGFIYVAAGLAGLRVIDVRRPTAPVEVARVVLPCEARGVVSEAGLTVVVGPQRMGDRPQGSLRVLNTQDPLRPQALGSYNTPGDANSVALRSRVAWVADGVTGLWAISVEDPTAPTFLGRFNSPGEALDVVIREQIAYLADGSAGGLQIISVTDARNPRRLGGLAAQGAAHRLAVGPAGRIALIDSPQGGVLLADATRPDAPLARGRIAAPGYASDVDVAGKVAFVANGFGGVWTVDVADPGRPTDLALLADTLGEAGPTGQLPVGGESVALQVVGEWVYLANAQAGVRTILAQNPAAPRLVGSVSIPGCAQALRVRSELIFVAAGTGGLRVISARTPAAPVEIGSNVAPADASDLALVGSIAYVADRYAGLRALSIADPTRPSLLAGLPIAGPINGLDATGSLLGLAMGHGGLAFFSVDAAGNMRPRGRVASLGYAWEIALVDADAVGGPTAFLADGAAGVRAINIARPDAPVEWGQLTLAGEANAVRYQDGRLYVTTKEGGLWIIAVVRPQPRAHLPLIWRALGNW